MSKVNSAAHASTKEPLVAKARAVTTSATQLALKSLILFSIVYDLSGYDSL